MKKKKESIEDFNDRIRRETHQVYIEQLGALKDKELKDLIAESLKSYDNKYSTEDVIKIPRMKTLCRKIKKLLGEDEMEKIMINLSLFSRLMEEGCRRWVKEKV